MTPPCQSGVWKYLGLQPFKTTYMVSVSRGIDAGPVKANCNAGDLLLSVTTMACPSAYQGSLESVVSTTNSATLYCDLGTNGIYDGGTIGISCARN